MQINLGDEQREAIKAALAWPLVRADNNLRTDLGSWDLALANPHQESRRVEARASPLDELLGHAITYE